MIYYYQLQFLGEEPALKVKQSQHWCLSSSRGGDRCAGLQNCEALYASGRRTRPNSARDVPSRYTLLNSAVHINRTIWESNRINPSDRVIWQTFGVTFMWQGSHKSHITFKVWEACPPRHSAECTQVHIKNKRRMGCLSEVLLDFERNVLTTFIYFLLNS